MSVVGYIAGFTKKTTKRGDTMAFVQLDDRTGTIELIVFPKQYQEHTELFGIGQGLYAEGRISVREGEKAKIVSEKFLRLLTNQEYAESKRPQKKLYLRVPDLETPEAQIVLRILSCVKGNTPVMFYCTNTGKYLNARGYESQVDERLLRDLEKILGQGNVVFK